MKTEGCRAEFEARYTFWEHLSGDEQALLCRHTRTAVFEKGTHLHSGSDDCLGLLLLKRGQLRTYILSEDGREVTLYRLFAGDVCILSASCVLSAITFDVYIDAEEETEVLITSSSFFHQIAEHNIHAQCFGYKLATDRFSEVMWAMQQILFMSFDRRLAIFLIDESAKTGGDVLHMTHEQIARYMGSAREVVSRMLKYFADEGLVELSRGTVRILDKKRLRSLT